MIPLLTDARVQRNAPRWRSLPKLGNAAVVLLLAFIAGVLWRATSGPWWIAMPLAERWWMAGMLVVVYLLGCGWIWFRDPRRRASSFGRVAIDDTSTVVVAYASQTGMAFELAQQTAEALNAAGISAYFTAIDRIHRDRFAQGGRLLIVASTTGQGDPPDHAIGFLREVMDRPLSLESLRYAVLALGDRSYEQFCAFGHQLDRWLQAQQAQRLFPVVEVDNADPLALRHWQTQVAEVCEADNGIAWQSTQSDDWSLDSRIELNANGCASSVFHLTMTPPQSKLPQWQAGDIAEVYPRHSPRLVAEWLETMGFEGAAIVQRQGRRVTLESVLAESQLPKLNSIGEIGAFDAQSLADRLQPLQCREYSIASLPSEGNLQLLVRRAVRVDGTIGLCSGWLCDSLQPTEKVKLRIRSNPNFHSQASDRPLILIGNGTGLAGLRGHLLERLESGYHENWLLFGERNMAHDFHLREEIQAWRDQGVIKRLDLAFSRDQAERVYVQDKLREAADELQQWVRNGAAIYVCGSLVGMAPAVDSVLRRVLGDAIVDDLLVDGRYRRDVY
ncbi:Sulfite reductase [NADPH] flavoprotein alpha-component [Novipirellula galeiformis]|uniref:NADPH--hemoprotein reductase n=1 Tax=Novipirellula galeiformis TaxID=2528004 RepID=A0A5C6C7L0_9BACT|nr:sulfite reductase flavoprotein subunit alpha [Novipirellula galeiformis]TWU20620.1 Sulfite reductase [NADPH] flavoprotein alpha-component [Novipirellula galeiformis]